jgi:hypothetical protein
MYKIVLLVLVALAITSAQQTWDLRVYTDAGQDATICSVPLNQFSPNVIFTGGFVDQNDVWTEANLPFGFQLNTGIVRV